MDFFEKGDIKDFSKPGVISRQLLNPLSSPDAKVTITQVHLESGAVQQRHVHESSEQVWYAEKGSGELLLDNGKVKKFSEGDVARFAANDVHGLKNNSSDEFIYISVTAPPINFGYAYNNKK